MWGYGKLNLENPYWCEDFDLGQGDSKDIELIGEGKVVQISFCSDNRHTILSLKVDNDEESNVNNGYCIEQLADSRGKGIVQIEKCKNDWFNGYRYNFYIPIIFKEKLKIRIISQTEKSKIKGLHVYYLIRR